MARTTLTARARIMAQPAALPVAPKKEPVSLGALLRGLILVLIVPTVVFVGVFAYGKYEHFSASAQAPGQPGALVWSDGAVIFANKKEVAAWLRTHGGSIEGFEKNHPAAVDLVSKTPPVTTQTKIAAGTKTPVHVEAVAPTPGANGGGTNNHASVYVLSVAALLLLLLAAAPVALFVRLPILRMLQAPELRLLFGGVGVAIAAGLAVSLLLG